MKKLLCLLLTLLLLNGCAAQPPVEDVPKEPAAASSAGNTASFPENESSSGNENVPEENIAQPQEEYIPSDWQRTVAENKVFLTAQQRLDAAAEKFDLSNCNVLRVTEISADDLDAEQLAAIKKQISSDIFYVTLLRTEDGRIYFFEIRKESLLLGLYGFNDLVYPVAGRHLEFDLYYEGTLPESGRLDGLHVRSIEFVPTDGANPLRDFTVLQDRWYESMRTTPDISLYGHEEALDHYLRRIGWQGFEKKHKANGAEYYTNGELDIFPVDFNYPSISYCFDIYPSYARYYDIQYKPAGILVFSDGRILPSCYEAGHRLAQNYDISVGKESDTPVTYTDQIVLDTLGNVYPESRWESCTALTNTLDTGAFLLRMAHVYEPSLTAGEKPQTDLRFIQTYIKQQAPFSDYYSDELSGSSLNCFLQFSNGIATEEPGFGRTARQLALWQDAENPDHLWIGYQDATQPADAPWEILGWETGGRWLEKQVVLYQWWRFFQFNLSADCTAVDCVCRNTLARWSAAAVPVGGNVQCSRSGKNDNTDRLAQKLLFLVQNADSQAASQAQDPAALAADGLSYLERDEGRYGLVFPDEPSALDMVYLQTDPAVAAQHDFPTQLLAWVDPAQPDDLLIATPAADGWQTVCYPGWGAWLHFDLAVGAIGLP